MRICIDARSLREVMTGLGRYAAHLVYQLAALDQENEYIVIRRPNQRGPLVLQENFREIFLPYDISSARNILAGAEVINQLHADIYHALYHFLPLGVRAGRVIVTLHDLIWVDHSSLADGKRWRRWLKGSLGNLGIRRAMTAADHIITVSESTRQAALSAHALSASKLTTVHHGVDPFFFSRAAVSLPAHCQGRDFIFTLGNSLPYKNIPRLIRAFSILAPQYPDLFLLLVGRGESYPALVRLAGRLGLADRVLFSGPLSDAQVHACYAQALLFAFPSLVEGFGLPVLEAMASGCPVLTANTSSLAEIAGEAAVLIDPLEVEEIAAGMRRLLDSADLRQQLVEQGERRAALFTWEECARKTLAVYRRLHAPLGWTEPAPFLEEAERYCR